MRFVTDIRTLRSGGDPDREAGTFRVWFIPETLEKTIFGNKQVGDRVNLELDQQTQTIVESVERMLAER